MSGLAFVRPLTQVRMTSTQRSKFSSATRSYSANTRPIQPHTLHGHLNRSFLYVPASNDRMLAKSLSTNSDMIIYDLEDSVPPQPEAKETARNRLANFLTSSSSALPHPRRLGVRINSINTPFFKEDIAMALRFPQLTTLLLPKIHSPTDLHHVSWKIFNIAQSHSRRDPYQSHSLQIIASIESARSMYNLSGIASWQSEYGPTMGGKLFALLFAAEDYCADTSIIRTPSRRELLFTRSSIVITAKAFGLQAIDMVCVNYKDMDYLQAECQDGRELGFTGKQAIHPTQVDIIQSAFVPSPKEILRAARILHSMDKAHAAQRGAIGLQTDDGVEEMIDAPMIKQAENTIRIAKQAGLEIPHFEV